MKRAFNKRHACTNTTCQLEHNKDYDPLKCPKIKKISEMLSPDKREQYLKDVQKFVEKMNLSKK